MYWVMYVFKVANIKIIGRYMYVHTSSLNFQLFVIHDASKKLKGRSKLRNLMKPHESMIKRLKIILITCCKCTLSIMTITWISLNQAP